MKKITLCLLLLHIVTAVAQTDRLKIQTWLDSNHKKYGLAADDIKDWVVKSNSSSKATKITNYYLQQQHKGIEIFAAVSNICIKNGEVIRFGNRFVSNVAPKANTQIPAIIVTAALAKAYVLLDITTTQNFEILENSKLNYYKISNGFSQKNPVSARLVYQLTATNKLKLAWDFTIHTPDHLQVWGIRIDAANGELLEKTALLLSCQFESGTHEHNPAPQTAEFSQNFFKTQTALPFLINNSSYRVIPFNYQSPMEHERLLIANPYHTAASPKGWHDTNALNQNNPDQLFTFTRGNNVHAVEDWNGDNLDGAAAEGTAELLFDFPYEGTTVAAANSIDASLTNLFYMTNVMHDVWHNYGFDEANGNFQHTNYSESGLGADAVIAQTQDRGQTVEIGNQLYNNANFYTPVDGESSLLQMFLFNYKIAPLCTVNSPASVAGNYTASYNAFVEGNVDLPGGAGLTADLTLFDSGNNSGCSNSFNNLSGKIVLFNNAGSCAYTDRVFKMQQAGAVAAIFISSTPDIPQRMGGSNSLITIPVISISLSSGNIIKAALLNGTVNMTLTGSGIPFVNADSSFDNAIIAHEYAHGISTRLTGGANTSECLYNAEQAGEGWSDWIAMMMQLKPGDVGETPKTLGNYSLNQPNNGPGIRTKPYSIDFAVNNLTFNSTNIVAPHPRGEFMAAVLWDLTWAYIEKYGFDNDIYNGNGGNNKVMQLVLDGLKLQPCSPTFIDFREALFIADNATTNGADFCMIAETFRKRGMGVAASSGSPYSATDQFENFDAFTPDANCTLSANYFENSDLLRIYPNPNNGLLTIRIAKFNGNANIEIVDSNGRVVYNQNTAFNLEETIDISLLQSGIYLIKISGDRLNYTQKIIRR